MCDINQKYGDKMTAGPGELAHANLSRLEDVLLAAASLMVPLLEPDPVPGSHMSGTAKRSKRFSSSRKVRP